MEWPGSLKDAERSEVDRKERTMVPAETGMVRKTPTLEDIHKSIHSLMEIANDITSAIVVINSFLENPDQSPVCESEKNPEQPCGKLREIERSVGVVSAELQSILHAEKRIMQTLGCSE